MMPNGARVVTVEIGERVTRSPSPSHRTFTGCTDTSSPGAHASLVEAVVVTRVWIIRTTARVVYRLALDLPERVSHLVSLDTVPTLDIWDAWDMTASIEGFHWPFLAQPAPVPERLMAVVKLPPARRSGSVAGVTGACVCDGSGLNWLRVG